MPVTTHLSLDALGLPLVQGSRTALVWLQSAQGRSCELRKVGNAASYQQQLWSAVLLLVVGRSRLIMHTNFLPPLTHLRHALRPLPGRDADWCQPERWEARVHGQEGTGADANVPVHSHHSGR